MRTFYRPGHIAQWESACLGCMRPRVQSSALQNEQKSRTVLIEEKSENLSPPYLQKERVDEHASSKERCTVIVLFEIKFQGTLYFFEGSRMVSKTIKRPFKYN